MAYAPLGEALSFLQTILEFLLPPLIKDPPFFSLESTTQHREMIAEPPDDEDEARVLGPKPTPNPFHSTN